MCPVCNWPTVSAAATFAFNVVKLCLTFVVFLCFWGLFSCNNPQFCSSDSRTDVSVNYLSRLLDLSTAFSCMEDSTVRDDQCGRCQRRWLELPRRRPQFEAFTTDAKIIRLISRRVALFPTAAIATRLITAWLINLPISLKHDGTTSQLQVELLQFRDV